MPAFGKNGIVNVESSAAKDIWTLKTSDGKILMSCDNEQQAMEHKVSLSQKMNKEITVEKKSLRCI